MHPQLITSTDKDIYNEVCDLLKQADEEILIICPYINTELLDTILPSRNINVSIITSWKVQDIWFGSSDLSLYKYTNSKSIQLYINNRVHLKVFMTDWEKVVLGSANLTRNGLGISNKYNYELNSSHAEIETDIKLYLRKILANSILVNDKIYNEYLSAVEELPSPPILNDPTIDQSNEINDFLISALPMSKDVSILFNLYCNNFNSDDKEVIECALHDIALYEIPLNLTKDYFTLHLKNAFFNSKFIQAFLVNIDNEGKYFGSVKEWVQNTCTDVPIPSRRDLTGNIQVLYKWIVELSDGRYLVDRPNYSERIYKA